jgi:hypothetical protein
MRVYTVHVPPFSYRNGDPILIKEGFSWPAFLFGPLWALADRLWLVTVALVVVLLALGTVLETLGFDSTIQSIVSLAVAILIGAHGNDWRRRTLARRGFREAGVVAARTLDEALARYLDAEPPPSRPARVRANPMPPPPMPVAGL